MTLISTSAHRATKNYHTQPASCTYSPGSSPSNLMIFHSWPIIVPRSCPPPLPTAARAHPRTPQNTGLYYSLVTNPHDGNPRSSEQTKYHFSQDYTHLLHARHAFVLNYCCCCASQFCTVHHAPSTFCCPYCRFCISASARCQAPDTNSACQHHCSRRCCRWNITRSRRRTQHRTAFYYYNPKLPGKNPTVASDHVSCYL